MYCLCNHLHMYCLCNHFYISNPNVLAILVYNVMVMPIKLLLNWIELNSQLPSWTALSLVWSTWRNIENPLPSKQNINLSSFGTTWLKYQDTPFPPKPGRCWFRAGSGLVLKRFGAGSYLRTSSIFHRPRAIVGLATSLNHVIRLRCPSWTFWNVVTGY